jgi:glucosyl-dolichyl phosphate glucuronosyltransferase
VNGNSSGERSEACLAFQNFYNLSRGFNFEGPFLTDRPAISAIICTHKRYKLVSAAIKSVLSQDIDRQEYEIIVVDNSPDAVQAADFSAQYAGIVNFQYVHEPTPGLSNARNVGARLAGAPIIAYLDDDAVAPPQWLRSLLAGYQKFGDEAAIIGGPVEPIWIKPRPKWLTSELEGFFSIVDYGGDMRELLPHEWLAGCNYSLRRDWLFSAGGFSTQLGRRGALSLLSNEEMLVSDSIRMRGGKIIYVPQAGVKHYIDPSRTSADWLKRRIAWQAVSDSISRPQEALRRAEVASYRFDRYSKFGRGLVFADLISRRKDISAADYDRIYHAIIILLCRGS